MLKFLQKTDSRLGDATPNTGGGRGHHQRGFVTSKEDSNF